MTYRLPKREHFNLYYLFREDKARHPLPPGRVEEIRAKWKQMTVPEGKKIKK